MKMSTENVTPKELENRFQYHPPKNENQQKKYEHIRYMGHEFAKVLMNNVPDCRERDFAIKKVEEVCFWANAGVARREP